MRNSALGARVAGLGRLALADDGAPCETGLPQLTSREAKPKRRVQGAWGWGPTRINSACGPSEARSRRARARGGGAPRASIAPAARARREVAERERVGAGPHAHGVKRTTCTAYVP